ncbi:MAG: MerR family transcriptional regulator [Candidatus Binataceae bacterium]
MNRSPRRTNSRKEKTVKTSQAAGSARTYKIGEASRLVGVAPFVLRFWETQFTFLRPRHTPSRHRSYVERDIETLKAVKRLLHKERFTIEGAKKYIRENGLAAVMKSVTAADSRASGNSPRAHSETHSGRETELRRTLDEVHRELLLLREKLGE